MSYEVLIAFDKIVDHVKINYTEKCNYEVIKSDSVALLMIWYIDANNNPTWLNLCVRSIDTKDYFEIQLLDRNIDEVKKEESVNACEVAEWINRELSLSKTGCSIAGFL
ncbi:hypothetical protein [Paenibacillus chitinolyticus]|uniref:hypothetical protein n=1 Tax=Paenibacillus chitinolyticus TaxID=79263 RepID=UPI001C488D15|nr:hypothetical protein [Paenibacillus chitinolyticus]